MAWEQLASGGHLAIHLAQALTLSLQCLHTVCSLLPSGARQPRHVSRFCANFMMPPEATDGVVTMMDRV